MFRVLNLKDQYYLILLNGSIAIGYGSEKGINVDERRVLGKSWEEINLMSHRTTRVALKLKYLMESTDCLPGKVQIKSIEDLEVWVEYHMRYCQKQDLNDQFWKGVNSAYINMHNALRELSKFSQQ